MAYQIIVKKRFTNKVQKYLPTSKKDGHTKWPMDFFKNRPPYRNAYQTTLYWQAIIENKKCKSLLITRHNKFYYTVKDDKVIILNMYDTRINPKKNPY